MPVTSPTTSPPRAQAAGSWPGMVMMPCPVEEGDVDRIQTEQAGAVHGDALIDPQVVAAVSLWRAVSEAGHQGHAC